MSKRTWITVILLCGVILLAVALRVVLPVLLEIGPPCLIKAAWGYDCPSCGITRSALFLLSGHPYAAFRMNPFVTLAIPAMGLWLLWMLVQKHRRGYWPNVRVRWVMLGLAAFLLFGILRNLSWPPFHWLAPTYLPWTFVP